MKLIPLGLNARKHRGYFAKVDDEDYEELMKYRWHASYNSETRSFYAVGYVKGRNVAMHRWLIRAPKGKEVDHINHDTLDNRKSNIRLCFTSQNQGNARKHKRKTSQYKGVSWCKKLKKWRAYIGKDRKDISIGSFSTEEEAAQAYDDRALEYFGEFAHLNFPKG